MQTNLVVPSPDQIFQRVLTAHLPRPSFDKLQATTALVAGLGGGSNIAELLARKGIGGLIIADLDIYEEHNVRQRGCSLSTLGEEKTVAMRARLLDINPHLSIHTVSQGITLENVDELVRQSDYVIDMLDFSALSEKIALYRAARRQKKTVLTAPSVINGAVLYVFGPEGPTYEDFFGFDPSLNKQDMSLRFLKKLIPDYPPEAPESMYRQAARGQRNIPLDAVGVDQASVLLVAALENLVLGRDDRVIFAPRGIQVDLSNPQFFIKVIQFSDIEEG
ncbi:MAG: ThiF family adenylyltransferase [Planctomycetota bacterium]|nr:ThiF family adenylyltransferase [Planctomycetota bacterium]